MLLIGSLAVAAVGCGGGGDKQRTGLPGGAAARVDTTVIQESAVQARVKAVYRSSGGSIESFGPPDYTACVKIKSIQLKLGSKKDRRSASPQSLRDACQADFQSARAQAVNILVRAQWLAREAKRQHIDFHPRARQLLQGLLEPVPGRPTNDPGDAKLQSQATAQEEGLMAALPITKQELKSSGGAVGYAARLVRLNKALHQHYASDTLCARKYKVPAAPECQ